MLNSINSFACTFFVLLTILIVSVEGCYTSIFGFGDSLTDAGNLIALSPPNVIPHMGFPPYGMTYFHYPSGRCSDGRLIIDYIAEYFGLPYPPPSITAMKGSHQNIGKGANFAVVGSRALDAEFYIERGIIDPVTNISMADQLGWFKDSLPFLCDTPSSCRLMFETSLILLGEFGGNDYTHSFLSGKSMKEVESFVPLVTNAIASAAIDLIELGFVTILVPGILPIGCASSYLTYFPSPRRHDYDENGCLRRFNKFAEYHNKQLQRELSRTRELHPHASIIFADIYNAAMELYRSPTKYGFSEGGLRACCGGGGPYNYNWNALCGFPPSTSCKDPSSYVNWDGYHLTDEANKYVTNRLIEGPYTIPHINTFCLSLPA